MKRYKDCQPNYESSQVKRSETPYHMQLSARLTLDQLCYEWNEKYLIEQINQALDASDKKLFNEFSLKYKKFKNQ